SRAGRSGSGHARRERAAPGHRGDARPGLDRPLYAQYGAFLKGLGTGNLGSSLRTNQPVTAAIAERLPATFELAFAAMLVATAIAIPLGILAAVRVVTHVDYAATTLALVGISIPD